MRRLALAFTAGVILLGPTVLAFREGGTFDDSAHPVVSRVAALVAWGLVLLVALLARTPLPRRAAGRIALGGLLVLTVWTGASLAWAPLAGPALGNTERLALYLAALTVAATCLRSVGARRAVEPLLALGAFATLAYGLSGRLLPGIISQAHSGIAQGRLEQPITYYNAEGALAAMGLVLGVRILGDPTRGRTARVLAAAAAPALLLGLWLTYSRAALAACAAGLVVLLALAPTRPQLRATAIAVGAGAIAVGGTFAFALVSSVSGPLGPRERDGAAMLAVLLAVTGAAAAAAWWTIRRERRAASMPDRPPLARWGAVVAPLVVLLVGGALVAFGLSEHGAANALPSRASAARLTSASSNRHAYWDVALRGFAREPVRGVGAGGFRALWLRERPVRETVQSVHSLELGTLTELGVVGAAALLALFGGVGLAARRAYRAHPDLVAGWCAALTVFALHTLVDWDWELPAVTLVALALGGALVAVADEVGAEGTAASVAADGEAATVARSPDGDAETESRPVVGPHASA